jgi:lysine 6-dehydrogenase
MAIDYVVFGAGRQGTACAYDLAKFGDARQVTLADRDPAVAAAAAERVNQLTGTTVATSVSLDVGDPSAVARTLSGCEVAISAVPYFLNLALTRLAIEAGVSFCDLGGNTDIVRQQHALDGDARRAGVSVVPDCGMGPGMGNTLAVYAMELLDETEAVRIYDGGLPLDPRPPWNYVASFSIEGVTNEYHGTMTVLQDGELREVAAFSGFELVDFPPLGRLEAFVAVGGVSTAPLTFKGRLKNYDLKILRYPGTYAQLRAFSDLGLFHLDPVQVDGAPVVPRHLFHTLFEPQVHAEVVKDICIIRVYASGRKTGQPATAIVQLVDRYDPATGFSSMERMTGWHASIVASLIAHGQIRHGVVSVEIGLPGHKFVEAAKLRGFEVSAEIEAGVGRVGPAPGNASAAAV